VIFSYLLTLFGVCGLAVGALLALRALKGGNLALGGDQPIRVVGRQLVGGGSTLMLVEVDGQRLLIGVSRAGLAVLNTSGVAPSNVVPIDNGFRVTLRRGKNG
jgi:flagellar biogenesis protein FliO